MPSTTPFSNPFSAPQSTTPPPTPDVDALARASLLAELRPIGASHDDVRRYSRARRNVLPRTDQVTVVADRWAHQMVLRSGADIELALWCPGGCRRPDLEATADDVVVRAARAYRVSERTLTRLQPETAPPALLSMVRLPRWDVAEVLGAGARLVLVADGIAYAGNLGTLVRTADACGADALVLTRAAARVTHPKVFVASRGTILTTPVITFDSVRGARARLAAAGFTAYVADPAGTTPYRGAGLGTGRTAVVVGSEGEGVTDEWRDGLTRVAIPMHGRADSLNVAVSAAVLLFEAREALDGG